GRGRWCGPSSVRRNRGSSCWKKRAAKGSTTPNAFARQASITTSETPGAGASRRFDRERRYFPAAGGGSDAPRKKLRPSANITLVPLAVGDPFLARYPSTITSLPI